MKFMQHIIRKTSKSSFFNFNYMLNVSRETLNIYKFYKNDLFDLILQIKYYIRGERMENE